jgi:hypothetical protein
MTSEAAWRKAIVGRFPSRPVVPAAEVFDQIWAEGGVEREEVDAVLDLLSQEYGIEPGFFRPTDLLKWLLEPVRDGGLWSRAADEVRAGDRQLELGAYLEQRCRARGVPIPRGLSTLGQLLRACSGHRAI